MEMIFYSLCWLCHGFLARVAVAGRVMGGGGRVAAPLSRPGAVTSSLEQPTGPVIRGSRFKNSGRPADSSGGLPASQRAIFSTHRCREQIGNGVECVSLHWGSTEYYQQGEDECAEHFGES